MPRRPIGGTFGDAEASPARVGMARGASLAPLGANPSHLHPLPDALVATCAGGLEPALAGEIRAHGWTVVAEEPGAVRFRSSDGTVPADLTAEANLRLRTASRILVPVARGAVRTFDDLYRLAARVKWTALVPITKSFSVSALTTGRQLTDRKFAALRVKDAIVDNQRRTARRRSDVDRGSPDVPIVVFISDEIAEVSLDSSGRPLHERGYRLECGTAPLRETLAAGILLLAGWTPETPLLDPFCGSGTIAVEAALLAGGIAPGILRRDFAFLHWPEADAGAFERLKARVSRREGRDGEQRDREGRPTSIRINAEDIDPVAIEIAQRNAARAGVADAVTFRTADFFSAPLHDRDSPAVTGQPAGIIVTNPPYGERLDVGDAATFYHRLGDRLKERFGGWTAWILSANAAAMKQLGLRISSRIPVFNGGLEARLYRVDLYPSRSRGDRQAR